MNEYEEAKLKQEIDDVLSGYPEAKDLVLTYSSYVHDIDDLVDGDTEFTPETLLTLTNKASLLFSNRFYRENAQYLHPVETMVNVAYSISVSWEKEEGWKKAHADVLRHAGLYFFITVIYLIAGYEVVSKIAPKIFEYAHTKHLNDLISYESNKQT